MEPKEISDWQHEEFYRYIAQAYDKPRYTLHYRADAPLNIRSIFYVPDSVRRSLQGPGCDQKDIYTWRYESFCVTAE